MSAELRLDTVLQRLVGEVTSLLDADAADCYLHDADRAIIRCVAVHGLDPDPGRLRGAARAGPRRRRVPRAPLGRLARLRAHRGGFPEPGLRELQVRSRGADDRGRRGAGHARRRLAGSRAGDSTRPTARRSRLSPAWPRSRSTMPRASRSANGGAGSSAASSSSRLRSPSRCHSRKRSTPSRRPRPRHSAAASPRC